MVDATEARHLTIAGRVQGVGYRAFMVREAERLGIAGWVRNRRDGNVEAVVTGHAEAIAAILACCRQGPPGARVDVIEVELAAVFPDMRDFQARQSV